jgi:hypothetical protein
VRSRFRAHDERRALGVTQIGTAGPEERDPVPKHLVTTGLVTARSRRWVGAATAFATVAVAAAVALPAGWASAASPAASSSAASTSAASTSAASTSAAARFGAGYLARQISANGGYLTAYGAPDVVDTAYAVVGLHAARVGAAASDQAIKYLKTQLGVPLEGSDGGDNPGSLAVFILAAVSAGKDPRHFGGTAAENDLVGRLLASGRKTGPDAGLFGSADPLYDGAYRQGLSLAALKAVGVARTNSAVSAGIGWLTHQQCANGLWTSYRAAASGPCPAADPLTYAGPDTNSTGMAVQGLAAYGLHPRQGPLLASLRQVQSADGGFPFLAAPGQSSDPDSTALAIQTILAENGYPATAGWTKGGATPYAALASFQLGCSDLFADRGGFFYPGTRTPNTLASVQAVPALAGKTFPLAATTSSSAVPRANCQAPSVAQVAQGARAGLAEAALASARAGTAGHCPGKTGVTVAVDLSAFGKGVQVRCAPGAPATGVAALQQAGFTVAGTSRYGLAFVCRIQGFPTAVQDPCVNTPAPTAYWAYYHALAGATSWTFSTLGASSYKPPQGSIDAWAFGNSAKPKKTPAQVRAL